MPTKKPPRLDGNIPKERKVSDEERQLWHQVMGVETMPVTTPAALPSPPPVEKPKANPEQLEKLAKGGIGNEAKKLEDLSVATGNTIDWKRARQLRQGKIEPDALIDLHGMRQKEAHTVLEGFLASSQQSGRKMVLVITGRGDRDQGALRANLPKWLASPPCMAYVSAYAGAHIRHGGKGAFYVLLRKAK